MVQPTCKCHKRVDRSERQNDQGTMELDVSPEPDHRTVEYVPAASEEGYWVIRGGFLAAETRLLARC